MSAAIHLLSAVNAALRNDAELRTLLGQARDPQRVFGITDAPIYSGVQIDEPFPYITHNEVSSAAWDASDFFGEEITFDVHVWHRAASPLVAFTIGERVRRIVRAINSAPPSRLVLLDFASRRQFDEPDGLTHQVVLSFRAITQEA